MEGLRVPSPIQIEEYQALHGLRGDSSVFCVSVLICLFAWCWGLVDEPLAGLPPCLPQGSLDLWKANKHITSMILEEKAKTQGTGWVGDCGSWRATETKQGLVGDNRRA